MPLLRRLESRDEIRRRLNADRIWSLYALADLDDPLFSLCECWTLDEGDDGGSLVLVFHGLRIRPVFVLSPDAMTAARLLDGLEIESGYVNLRDHHLPDAGRVFDFQGDHHRMHRMVLDEGLYRPHSDWRDARRLTAADAPAIEQLYATGDGGGTAFHPSQLDSGHFHGLLDERSALVAVAGVHVASVNEGIAGVGNIFTHPDHRGRGLAQLVTTAVVESVLATGIRTIGLNVEGTNAPARAAYAKLGFQSAFEYVEGVAQHLSLKSHVGTG